MIAVCRLRRLRRSRSHVTKRLAQSVWRERPNAAASGSLLSSASALWICSCSCAMTSTRFATFSTLGLATSRASFRSEEILRVDALTALQRRSSSSTRLAFVFICPACCASCCASWCASCCFLVCQTQNNRVNSIDLESRRWRSEQNII